MMKYPRIIAVLFAILFCASDLFAQTGIADSTAAPIEKMYSPSIMSILFKLVISLVLIIGLIYLSTYFMKRMNSRVTGRGSMGDTIKIMGRTFLSPKQSLCLVKIGKKYTVLGVSDQNVTKITELSDEEAAAVEKGGAAEQNASFGKFSEIFKGILRR